MLISIKISRNLVFLGSDKPRMLFFLLINVKMPTIVGILTFVSRKNSMLSWVEHEKSFIASGLIWICNVCLDLSQCVKSYGSSLAVLLRFWLSIFVLRELRSHNTKWKRATWILTVQAGSNTNSLFPGVCKAIFPYCNTPSRGLCAG